MDEPGGVVTTLRTMLGVVTAVVIVVAFPTSAVVFAVAVTTLLAVGIWAEGK